MIDIDLLLFEYKTETILRADLQYCLAQSSYFLKDTSSKNTVGLEWFKQGIF